MSNSNTRHGIRDSLSARSLRGQVDRRGAEVTELISHKEQVAGLYAYPLLCFAQESGKKGKFGGVESKDESKYRVSEDCTSESSKNERHAHYRATVEHGYQESGHLRRPIQEQWFCLQEESAPDPIDAAQVGKSST